MLKIILSLIVFSPVIWAEPVSEDGQLLKEATIRSDKGAEAHAGHHHTAPHGGLLVPFGDHGGNLEIVFDSGSGKVQIFVLDGCADDYVRISQSTIDLVIQRVNPDKQKTAEPEKKILRLSLNAVADPLSGETVGDTSAFSLQTDLLLGVEKFYGIVKLLDFKGVKFERIGFSL